MDSQTTINTFKINSPQPSNLTETPLQYKSSTQNNSTFRDISFSSYLNPKDVAPNPQERDANHTPDDTEISIFDAHKYFSEKNDPEDIKRQQDSLSVPRLSSVSSVDGYRKNFRTRSFNGTPKTASEVSWNSQTGLLANPPGVHSPSNKRVVVSAAKKWFFGRKCCCSGKKSVQVKEVYSNLEQRKPVVLINNQKEKEPQGLEIGQNKGSLSPRNISTLYQSSHCRVSASGRPFIDGPIGFTFPILNPSSDKGSIAKPVIKSAEDPLMANPVAKRTSKPLEDPSMDNPVNSGSAMVRLRTSKALEDPSMDNPVNPGSAMVRDDDVGSDASSDLFEIESFSNQTTLYGSKDSLDKEPACNVARNFTSTDGINNNIQCGGKSLDEPLPPPQAAASVAATQCYPHIEAISASEIGGAEFLIRQRVEEAGEDSGKRQDNNGVVLMSCRQEKAVGLGPQPVKCVAEGPLMFPLHVGGRPQRADKPPLGSASHSATTRWSLAFAAWNFGFISTSWW